MALLGGFLGPSSGTEKQNKETMILDLHIRCLENLKNILPKWWLFMVIYHSRIRKKSPKKMHGSFVFLQGRWVVGLESSNFW